MTLRNDPMIAATASGAILPFIALAQGELLAVDESSNPLLRDVFGPGVHFKPLRVDVEAGCWVVLAVLSPGAKMPVHYVYEPAGSVRALVCPESNTEDTVILIPVEGATISFTDDGQFQSILDAAMIYDATPMVAQDQEVGPLRYIAGSSAGLTAPEE